jgi:cyanophycinase
MVENQAEIAMITRRCAMLLGGSGAFDAAAELFVEAAGGSAASIALLLQGGHDWQKYVAQYVEPWIQHGVAGCYPIAPREDGTLDLQAASARLRTATGFYVGGGHTPIYQGLYATEPLRSIIRTRHEEGVPYAGMSAGALIAADICPVPPEDAGESAVRVLAGLGLIQHVIVGVHFTEWNALPHVLDAMVRTKTAAGWGIDDDACATFEDGRFKRALGGSVYEIQMTDFRTQTYRMIEHRSS